MHNRRWILHNVGAALPPSRLHLTAELSSPTRGEGILQARCRSPEATQFEIDDVAVGPQAIGCN